MTYSSPSSRARVVMSVAAEPASGSEMPMAIVTSPLTTFGRYVSRCSWVPKNSSTRAGPTFASNTWKAAERHSLASSSITMSASRRVPPAPPCSSGRARPRKPSSARRATSSAGSGVRSRSHCAALGAYTSLATFAATSRRWSCSSLSRKPFTALSSDLGGLAAVDDVRGAADEAAQRRGQVADQGADLRRVGDPAGGDLGDPAAQRLRVVQDGALRLGGEGAGGDGVHLDVVPGPLGGQRLGEPDQGALGGGVDREAALAADAGDGRDVDDLAGALADEDLPAGAGEQGGRDHVHREHVLQQLGGGVQ